MKLLRRRPHLWHANSETSISFFALQSVSHLIELDLETDQTPKLLIPRCDIVQLGEKGDYEREDAQKNYEKAHQLDSQNSQPLIALGRFFYAVMNDELTAKLYFRRALDLNGGEEYTRMLNNISTGEFGLD